MPDLWSTDELRLLRFATIINEVVQMIIFFPQSAYIFHSQSDTMYQTMKAHCSMRWARTIRILPEEDKPPASSRSDDDERSDQLDECGAQADNESADADAIQGVDQLSLVTTPCVKPGLASPSTKRKRKRRTSSKKNNSNSMNTN